MGLFDHFPYTNVHELNLDWVLSMMKALEAEWEAFIAGNSLTFADPMLHDVTKTYAKNTIVLDGNGNAYVSLQTVPVGVGLQNGDYWLMVFDYEAFIEKVNKNFTARYYRGSYRATAAMAIGDWLTVDDVLCKATAAIAVDDALEFGVNIEHFTLEDFIKAFMQSANQLIQQYKNDIDASEIAYRQQLAQDIANTTSSLQSQLDAAIAGVTVDSEVINARVGADGVTYPTLGDAIRTQVSDLKTGYRTLAKDSIANGNYVTNPSYANRLLGITPTTGGYRSHNTGAVIANANYEYFDNIPVIPNTTYIVGYGGSGANYFINYWDENGNVIAGVNKGQSGEGSNILATIYYDTVKVTTPDNAIKMSYSLPIANESHACVIQLEDPEDKLLFDNIPNNIVGIGKSYNPNLFCPDATYDGAYVAYTNGNIATLGTFFYEVIPVKANTQYTCGGYASVHLSEYNSAGNRVAGFNVATTKTFTTTATTAYIVLAADIASKSNIYLCEGAEGSATAYGSGSSYEINAYKILEVGSGKTYTTIQSAVNAAANYDTIKIYPGTYNEHVNVGNKFLIFEGLSKDACILTYGDGDYDYPPLIISKGVVRNLTIQTTSESLLGNAYAYTTHIDSDNSIGSSLYFENVYFHSPKVKTIGIGLRNNFKLTFFNCKFKCDTTEAAFYCHDDPIDRNSTGQLLNLIDCCLESNGSEAALLLQTQEFAGSNAILTAQRNIINNFGAGDDLHMVFWNPSIGGSGFLGSYDWTLAGSSAINTVADLNY